MLADYCCLVGGWAVRLAKSLKFISLAGWGDGGLPGGGELAGWSHWAVRVVRAWRVVWLLGMGVFRMVSNSGEVAPATVNSMGMAVSARQQVIFQIILDGSMGWERSTWKVQVSLAVIDSSGANCISSNETFGSIIVMFAGVSVISRRTFFTAKPQRF